MAWLKRLEVTGAGMGHPGPWFSKWGPQTSSKASPGDFSDMHILSLKRTSSCIQNTRGEPGACFQQPPT